MAFLIASHQGEKKPQICFTTKNPLPPAISPLSPVFFLRFWAFLAKGSSKTPKNIGKKIAISRQK
jgi:hypothetical protein